KTDAREKVWSYTYTPLGQPLTREWARPTGNAKVKTTYAYYDGASENAGHVSYKTQELRGVSYNDGTASVAYTYNRFGALATVTDATGTRSFDYLATGQLNAETLASGFYGARSLVQTYSGGLNTGYKLQLAGSPATIE